MNRCRHALCRVLDILVVASLLFCNMPPLTPKAYAAPAASAERIAYKSIVAHDETSPGPAADAQAADILAPTGGTRALSWDWQAPHAAGQGSYPPAGLKGDSPASPAQNPPATLRQEPQAVNRTWTFENGPEGWIPEGGVTYWEKYPSEGGHIGVWRSSTVGNAQYGYPITLRYSQRVSYNSGTISFYVNYYGKIGRASCRERVFGLV
jgi:hypothetical protein